MESALIVQYADSAVTEMPRLTLGQQNNLQKKDFVHMINPRA